MKYQILLLSFISYFALGAEVDQYTKMFESLPDVSSHLNDKANEMLVKGLAEANNQDSLCDEKKLYKSLQKYFANHSKGEFVIYALKDERVPKRRLKIQDSIFKYWNIWDGYLLGNSKANESELALSAIIQMRNTTIGVDKFEHMFGRGFSYFTHYYLHKESFEKTVKGGILGEKTLYGGNKFATGVFSYADLAANFNGMRFWNHILQYRPDILGDNYGPYVKCENSHWVQVKKIDFNHYVDDSMNETINCSKFPTRQTQEKYDRAAREALASTPYAHSKNICPLQNENLEQLKIKYKNYSDWMLNTNSATDRTLNYFGEFR